MAHKRTFSLSRREVWFRPIVLRDPRIHDLRVVSSSSISRYNS